MSTPDDAIINGPLIVTLYAHPTAAHPNGNDPATASRVCVIGLAAAREWLDAHGGYARLRATYDGPYISGWRIEKNTSPSAAGYIEPEPQA